MKIARIFSSQMLNLASRYAKQQIENPSENPNEKDFEVISSHLVCLHARLMALETMVDMAWTNQFANEKSPKVAATEFKYQVLGLVKHSDNLPAQLASEFIEQRLDAIIHRVKSL